jgi:polar amino acid transport system substrate-binding protein
MVRTRSIALLAASFLLLIGARPATAASTLEQIRANGAVRLGYVAQAEPFSYANPAGKPDGYAVALCQRIADRLKTELKLPSLRTDYVLLDADVRFDALAQGKIDILCAGGAPTVKRRQQVSFSIPVFLGGVGALMRDDAPARVRDLLEGRPEAYQPRWRASLGQVLRGQVFDVVNGTTTEAWLAGKLEEFNIAAGIFTVDSFQKGVDEVVAGRADVLWGDRAILLSTAARSPAAGDLIVLERHFTYEAVALALPRGDEDFRLVVDRALSDLFRSGEVSALYTPYFGKPSEQMLRFFQISSLPE